MDKTKLAKIMKAKGKKNVFAKLIAIQKKLQKRLDKNQKKDQYIGMIKQEIERLVSVLQALTLQKMEALRNGKQRQALQIQSVQVDIDNKIQDLERRLS